MSTQELDAVLADPRVWRGRRSAAAGAGAPSGLPALDAALPEGGFPRAALTEVFAPVAGIGELSLLLPMLVRETEAGGLLALIAPPYIPYAPALVAAGLDPARLLVVRTASLRESCWAMEQALRHGGCAAVIAWLEQRVAFAALRRLQLAAEAGGCIGIAFRAWDARSAASPAALRLALAAADIGPRITVLKCRGRAGRLAISP